LNEEALGFERIASEYKAIEEINQPLLPAQRRTADQRPRNNVANKDIGRRDDCLPRTELTLLSDHSQRNKTSSIQLDERILCQQELVPEIRTEDSSSTHYSVKHVFADKSHNSDDDKRDQPRKRSIDKYDGSQRHMTQEDVRTTLSDPPACSQTRPQIEVLPSRSVNIDQLANKGRKTLPQSTKLKTRHITHAEDVNTETLSIAVNINDQIDIGKHGGKIKCKLKISATIAISNSPPHKT
jgi:hypothetical protein